MSRENLEKEGITLLGNQKVKYPDNYAPEVLETFLNKHPDNDYFVNLTARNLQAFVPLPDSRISRRSRYPTYPVKKWWRANL